MPTVHCVLPSHNLSDRILLWQTLFGPKYLLGALPSVLSLMWDQVSHSYRAAGKAHTWQLCLLGSTNLQLHNLVLPWGKCFRLVRIIKLTVRVRSLMRIKDMHPPPSPTRARRLPRYSHPPITKDRQHVQGSFHLCNRQWHVLPDLSYCLFTSSWRCNMVLPAGQRLQPDRARR